MSTLYILPIALVRPTNRKFALGDVVMTQGAMALLFDNNQLAETFVARHVAGDWGDCGVEDTATNNESLIDGRRLLSVYVIVKDADGKTENDKKLWIITEWDRSVTTLLLPSEY